MENNGFSQDDYCEKLRSGILMEIISVMDWSKGSEAALQGIAEKLRELFGCHTASIYTADPSSLHFHGVFASKLPQEELQSDLTTLPSDIGRLSALLVDRQPIFVDFENPDIKDYIPSYIDRSGIKSAISIPLALGQKVLGLYSLVFSEHKAWSKEEIGFLYDIATLIAKAIDHQNIAARSQELALLDERRRLSVEVHDSIAQSIGSIKLVLESAQISYDAQDMEKLGSKLERAESMAAEALRAVREEMLALRIDLGEDSDFLSSLEESLSYFKKYWDVDIELDASVHGGNWTIPLEANLQVVRVVHEGLSNIIRHSGVRAAKLLIRREPSLLHMELSDNGCGFDLEKVPNDHFGLQIMRERILSIGGTIRFESNLGHGTSILVDVPLRM